MIAEHVQVARVENGWTVTVYVSGSHVMLVAKEIGEVCGYLTEMAWATPRPLYASDPIAHGAMNEAPTGASGSRRV